MWRKLSVWSGLIMRMQDKRKIYGYITNQNCVKPFGCIKDRNFLSRCTAVNMLLCWRCSQVKISIAFFNIFKDLCFVKILLYYNHHFCQFWVPVQNSYYSISPPPPHTHTHTHTLQKISTGFMLFFSVMSCL
jgi:hypothetical protein